MNDLSEGYFISREIIIDSEKDHATLLEEIAYKIMSYKPIADFIDREAGNKIGKCALSILEISNDKNKKCLNMLKKDRDLLISLQEGELK